MRFSLVITAALAAAVALADNATTRGKLSGTWQIDDQSTGRPATWVIEEKTDAVRLSYTTENGKPAEVECNTVGRECEVKQDGRKAAVSLWFNGPKLVQMETKGSEVVKRRFTVGSDGNTMEVETIPIVPAGKAEVVRFKRSPEQTAEK
jgi:hypothetical protein